MDKDLINQMLNEGRISFEKPRIALFVTKCKAGIKPAQLRSLLLIGTPYMPFPPLEPKDLGVN